MRPVGTVLLVVPLLLAGAGGLAAALTPAPGATEDAFKVPTEGIQALANAASAEEQLIAFSDGFASGEELGAQLLRAAARDASLSAGYELPALTFEEALGALQQAANVPVQQADEQPLGPALAQALAPVITATATAALMTDGAFADLSAEERAFLDENWHLAAGSPNPPVDEMDPSGARHEQRAGDIVRFEAMVQRVDLASLTLGASILADALDRFQVPVGTSMPTSWTSPAGLIEIGSTNDDTYVTERVLIVDLGGNDVYDNHAASYAPGSPLPVPVSAVLDAAGNDLYTTTDLHNGNDQASWAQGVGMSGIGMLVDRWGDDIYQVRATNEGTCDSTEGQRQLAYGQGVGTLGVGALFDLDGNDLYEVTSQDVGRVGCLYGFTYTFSQGVGLFGGLGILVDDTGDDRYLGASDATGSWTNIAHTHAQAAAAGGVGVLVDKEGHDAYESHANAHLASNGGMHRGTYAYVFAQASVLATRLNPALIPTSIDVAGLEETCVTTPLGFFVCVGGGGNTVTPCGILDEYGEVGANGPCDTPSAALLLDVAGSDTFLAAPEASQRTSNRCLDGNWAVGSAQGSAAFPGFAALVNVDVGTEDTFLIGPDARGGGCRSFDVRAHAYGQGYGGPLMWNPWDRPSVESDGLGVGVLLSPGTLRPHGCMLSDSQWGTATCWGEELPCDDHLPCLDESGMPGLPPGEMLEGPDSYESSAWAENTGRRCSSSACTTIAESRVQGAASREVTAAQGLSYRLFGAGLHIDTSGDDAFSSRAQAISGIASEGSPFSLAQGASTGGIGALVNLGGDDRYESYAIRYTSHMPSRVISQAEATPSTLVPAICTPDLSPIAPGGCVGTPAGPDRPAGVLVDIFGEDWYSQQQMFGGCPGNGDLIAPWIWGDSQGISCPAPGSAVSTTVLELGIDWASEVSI